jgi:hypothetical protein
MVRKFVESENHFRIEKTAEMTDENEPAWLKIKKCTQYDVCHLPALSSVRHHRTLDVETILFLSRAWVTLSELSHLLWRK